VAVAASAVAVLVERILWGSWSCFRKKRLAKQLLLAV
jgi:hypothetical protein